MNATVRTFDMQEVSADKAYSSRKNLEAITTIGADPFVPFRENVALPLGALGKEAIPEDDSA